MSDDFNDDFDDEYDDEYGDGGEGFEDDPTLDDHETDLVRQDLVDLGNFETTFRAEGYRGVSVYCQDCAEEHYYPWDMLRENLTTLLETGETPVHEPAFAPNPEEYIPWEYARGYVDALQDVGVDQRLEVDRCPRCGFDLDGALGRANFCPRCGHALLEARLWEALERRGVAADDIRGILNESGLPG